MADDQEPTVIQFPGAVPPKKPRAKTKRGPVVTQPQVPHGRLQLGPIHYSCPQCATRSEITGQNLIFRSIDAYCTGCGTLFRITNPAFSTKSSR
ncbi:hypothetical protein IGS68_31615 (plasmid) [Skermanella sp. TT6]|uniref:Transcription factor zinc-finger domain-containing protein n=1 Tax=Skermanella cutis TaxID=2775420 RepID=A0ABX7BHG8_9PROT|nr:hypothetical protein [Skermanella sp. TT6]QQP93575.1 hypothetical protein IGS68_31615 [Skermanella sp. TT6]